MHTINNYSSLLFSNNQNRDGENQVKEAAGEFFPVSSRSRRSIDPFFTTKQNTPVIYPDNSPQKKDRSSYDRSSHDRDIDNRRQRFEGGRSHRDNQFR